MVTEGTLSTKWEQVWLPASTAQSSFVSDIPEICGVACKTPLVGKEPLVPFLKSKKCSTANKLERTWTLIKTPPQVNMSVKCCQYNLHKTFEISKLRLEFVFISREKFCSFIAFYMPFQRQIHTFIIKRWYIVDLMMPLSSHSLPNVNEIANCALQWWRIPEFPDNIQHLHRSDKQI